MPDDLDRLLELVAGAGSHHGAGLRGRAPLRHRAAGREPGGRRLRARSTTCAEGALIDTGQVLGHVGEHEVRSPFAGVLQAFIAVDGERVTSRQPIAWLRTA